MNIQADTLSVRYPRASRRAVDRASFLSPAGTLRTVVGPNGCGKTTLLRSLLGVLQPERGLALLGGKPVSAWGARDRARAVGVVTQSEGFPFPLSVRELVGMGRYPHLGPLATAGPTDRRAVDEAMADCDLLHLAGRDLETLSGGEIQRARIARALAQRPGALVLDEPASNLDLNHRMEMFGLLRREADRGLAVLVVTHDLELAARFSDAMLLMAAGKVVADSSPQEVMNVDLLSRVYGWPVAVVFDPVARAPRVTPLDDPRRNQDSATEEHR